MSDRIFGDGVDVGDRIFGDGVDVGDSEALLLSADRTLSNCVQSAITLLLMR